MDRMIRLKREFARWREARGNKREHTPLALRRGVVEALHDGVQRKRIQTELRVGNRQLCEWKEEFAEQMIEKKRSGGDASCPSGVTVVKVVDADLREKMSRLRCGESIGQQPEPLAVMEHVSGWRLSFFRSDELVARSFVMAVTEACGGTRAVCGSN